VYIDQREYYIDRVEKILGILVSIIGVDVRCCPGAGAGEGRSARV